MVTICYCARGFDLAALCCCCLAGRLPLPLPLGICINLGSGSITRTLRTLHSNRMTISIETNGSIGEVHGVGLSVACTNVTLMYSNSARFMADVTDN